MTRDEAVTAILDTMGFRTDLTTKAVTALQQAQVILERNWPFRPLPWFLLTERESTSTVSAEERVPVPDDFIEETESDGLWLIDDDGGEHLLTKYYLDDLRKVDNERIDFDPNTNPDPADIMPAHYALLGGYFRLFPKPQKIWTIKMIYYGTATTLSAGSTENAWLKYAPYALIGHAGERLSAGARDKDALAIFKEWKTSAMAAFDINNQNRELANRRYSMGETL